jgi:hypothetical protein
MVSKSKKQSGGKATKGKVKVLNINKETLKDLTDEEAKSVKGGTLSYYQVSGAYSGSYVAPGGIVPPPKPSRGY